MTTLDYTVIVGQLPTSAETSVEYLQHMQVAFSKAKRYFVVMSDESFNSFYETEPFRTVIENDKFTVTLSHASTWDGINRAAADAESEYLVIFEDEMWPAPKIESEWFRETERSGVSITYFEKRRSYEPATHSMRAGYYSRCSPELSIKSRNAFGITRKDFLDIRGYDERPSYIEIADLDFSVRVMRARLQTSQLRGPDGVTYFSSTSSQLNKSIESQIKNEKANLAKVDRDESIYRNLVDWSVPANRRFPLVSVAIATKDRGEMLADALYSVLYQTFQDFEVIVVDDGSESDSAKQIVEHINDPRIRYIYQESSGISAARNRAADMSNCTYTAVHDDDDIMLPDRLEIGLQSITSPYQSTFGGWVNFGDGNGQMKQFYGKIVFDSNVNAHNGQGPGHATWTVPTVLIQQFRYDERLTASVDHNLATRLEIAGVEWIHSGHFMYLRRVHDSQVTALDSGGQKIGHSLSRYLSNVSSSTDQLNGLRKVGESTKYPRILNVPDMLLSFRAYLPDKLVNRQIRIEGNTQNLQFDADVPDKMTLLIEERDLLNNRNLFEGAILDDIKLKDIATFRKRAFVKYSWILQQTRDDLTPDDTLAENSLTEVDLEEDTIDQSHYRIREVLESRVALVSEKILKVNPQAALLVVENDEHYSSWADAELIRDSVEARRVLVAGEFGVKSSTRLYVYRSVAKGREVLARLSDSSSSISPSLLSN